MIRLGGISIFNGFFVSCFFIFLLSKATNILLINNSQFILIFLGSTFMFCLGLIDDLFQINNLLRLLSQFSIAAILFKNGLEFNRINLSFINENLNFLLSSNLSFLFSVVWLVGITNSINWIDGLDGLASGICVILLTGLLIINIINQNLIISLLCLIIIGCCIGFLKYNSYPAKIFMGDGGSYLLGFSFASISLITFANQNNSHYFPFILLIGLYPIIDMIFVISNRILKWKSPFRPDCNHFHHILRRNNFSHKKSVMIIYLINIFFCTLGIIGILFYKLN